MTWILQDRRARRSADRRHALRYQLESTKDKGNLEALVVVDDDGLLLAGAGDRSVCEELGAYAPLLSRSPLGMRLPPLLRGGEVAVRHLELEGQPLMIAALGGGVARDALLTHSGQGVRRILSSN